jgi:hypothetical protein
MTGQWEYYIAEFQGNDLVGFLNAQGAEGWELVLALNPECYYFKRPKR